MVDLHFFEILGILEHVYGNVSNFVVAQIAIKKYDNGIDLS